MRFIGASIGLKKKVIWVAHLPYIYKYTQLWHRSQYPNKRFSRNILEGDLGNKKAARVGEDHPDGAPGPTGREALAGGVAI
jgi:hypothetical protein